MANSPRDAAARADIVISMVADDFASEAMWLGDNGALAGVAAGTVLIESSTLSVSWIKELASVAAAKGCELLDAPVTGTKPHAAAGQLIFLVGGSEAALAKANPALAAMGKDIVPLGPTGSGSLMKLVNNFMAGVQAASFAEAVALVDAAGLNREKAISILTSGAPGSPLVNRIAGHLRQWGFHAKFYPAVDGKGSGLCGNRRHPQGSASANRFRSFGSLPAGSGERLRRRRLLCHHQIVQQGLKSPPVVH